MDNNERDQKISETHATVKLMRGDCISHDKRICKNEQNISRIIGIGAGAIIIITIVISIMGLWK